MILPGGNPRSDIKSEVIIVSSFRSLELLPFVIVKGVDIMIFNRPS